MRHAPALLPVFAVLLLLPRISDGAGPAGAPDSPVRVLSREATGLRLRFELPVSADKASDSAVPETTDWGIDGATNVVTPDGIVLPVIRRLLAVPPGATIRVRSNFLEVETRPAASPAQASRPDTDGEPPLPVETLGRPAADARLLGRIRNVDVACLTVRPVRYDRTTQSYEVARRVDVEIEFEGAPAKSGSSGAPAFIPPSYDALFRDLLVGYDRDALGLTLHPGAILYVLPDDPAVADTLESLLDWRRRKGADVLTATLSETGSTRNQILAYIQSVYDDPAVCLEHVVLVGDAANGIYVIPTWIRDFLWQGEGDYPYGLLAGGDPLPDVHVGRISFGNLPQLSIIVRKTVAYESSPDISDSTWFARAAVAADSSISGLSILDLGRWLKGELLEGGFAEVDTVFDGAFPSQMLAALTRGDALFGYRGFGGMSGWSNAWTSVTANGHRLPLAVTITCETGNFADGTAISEGFLRAGQLNPFIPQGGIGGIATATGATHTRFNNCIFYGIFQGVLHEGQYAAGAALDRGRLELFLNYGEHQLTNAINFAHWNSLMGDPAVDLWTGFPEPLAVDAPTVVPLEANMVRVGVGDGDGPLPGALVCVWKEGEFHAAGFTDASGTIDLAVAPSSTGDALLTVTARNRHPYLASIAVVDTEHVALESFEFRDGGDGVPNAGEEIPLSALLRNHGAELLPAVTGSLSTGDPFLSIVEGVRPFGDILAGDTVRVGEDFLFRVAPGCPDGHVASVLLTASSGAESWTSLIPVDVHSAAFAESTRTVLDEGGDGTIDPGETADLAFTIRNDGRLDAAACGATLRSTSGYVTVSDDTAFFGTVPAGGVATSGADRFTIHASSSAYDGYGAPLLLVLRFSGGAVDTIPLTLTIGTRTADDPVGPDAHGYLAFDDTDTAYADAPAPGWIEIDPAYGGSGAPLALNDYAEYKDATVFVDLPFPFRYYGEEHSRVSVCSNGWVAMGETPLFTYRNWTIPGAGGPDAMIAPFWDNLVMDAGSKVLTFWDAANHRWIVEWSRMRSFECGGLVTFECVLYDPAHHPSESGDGPIEFRYLDVTNCDFTDGYATVGVESPDQRDGLLFHYWNDASEGSAPLEPGRAIRITTALSGAIPTAVAEGTPPRAEGAGIVRCAPNPFNPRATITYQVDRRGPVEIAVYDITGRRVATLLRETVSPGLHDVVWNGRSDGGAGAASGVYFVRFAAGGASEVRRVTLVR